MTQTLLDCNIHGSGTSGPLGELARIGLGDRRTGARGRGRRPAPRRDLRLRLSVVIEHGLVRPSALPRVTIERGGGDTWAAAITGTIMPLERFDDDWYAETILRRGDDLRVSWEFEPTNSWHWVLRVVLL
jgi:hypothetical protein